MSKNQPDDARGRALREVWWMGTVLQDKYGEIDSLHDTLMELPQFQDGPTISQMRDVFMSLPDDIFGSIIANALGDTEVRESILAFLKENKKV